GDAFQLRRNVGTRHGAGPRRRRPARPDVPGPDHVRGAPPALPRLRRLAEGREPVPPAPQAAGGRGGFPPHRDHLQRLWPGRGRRAADPLRHHPAHHLGPRMVAPQPRDRAARPRHQRLPPRHLPPAGDRPRRPPAPGDDRPQRGLPAPDDRRRSSRRRLHPHRRHRPRPDRGRRVLRPRGQRPHPLGRELHAREPGNDAPDVPGAVRPEPRPPRLELPDGAPPQPRRLRAARRGLRPRRRRPHPRPLQLGLLRAQLPRRQDGRGAGRGPRPPRRGGPRRNADDAGLQAHRRALPPRGRRLPRPAELQPRQRSGRPRHLRRLPRGRHHAGQCPGHRHLRRQGHLLLHARHRPLLHGRGADPPERPHLALQRARGATLRPRQPRRPRRQGGPRLGRLRDAGRPHGFAPGAFDVPRQAPLQARQLHRPTDACAFHGAHLHQVRARPPPRGPAPLRPRLPPGGHDHPRRPHPRRPQEGKPRRELVPGGRDQGHLGARGM
ncbi:MAG: Protein containing domains DUF404, DUF407, partial [uncultured Rubellimicrobium sp.]